MPLTRNKFKQKVHALHLSSARIQPFLNITVNNVCYIKPKPYE